MTGVGKILAKSAGPVMGRIGDVLASKPIPQAIAAATGAGTGGALREGGASYPTQLTGNILGSLVAMPVASKIGKVGYHALIEPWANPAAIKGRAYLEAAGDKTDEIGSLLRQNKQIVPGSLPNVGEAAVPAGRAEFAALQRSASNVLPSKYIKLSDAQNAARIAQLQTVGKTPVELKAAEAARTTAANVNYGKAYDNIHNSLIQADDEFAAIAKNPFFGRAAKEISDLAGAKNVTLESNPTKYLHYVKTGLDKLLGKTGDTALDATEKKAVMDVKEQLVTWLGTKNKAYESARVEFAKASKPINQMEIGQFLEKKLVPALSEEAKQKSAAFAGALSDAPGTIKRATGGPRFEELTKILTPEQMAAVNSVKDDLARGARFDVLATKGAKAAPNAMDLASASMEREAGGKIPNLLHRAYGSKTTQG